MDWPTNKRRRAMNEWLKSMVEQVTAWPGVSSHEHRFGGVEFCLGTREIGHVHSFGIVDIPFTLKIRDALIHTGRAEQHHWVPDSGWTTVRVKERGAANALSLLRLSYFRIQLKGANPSELADASAELLASGLEHDVLDAAGLAVTALRT
jgi:hypothetical protein